ncbi:MAG: MCE family protein, partial [Deltaproteobacteria bacterium]|nr:MCE family protein [Deltaproteobacteria bacterium]
MKTTRPTQVRVGLLILLSLIALGSTVVMLGKERRFFENRVDYEIHYTRINGLTKGAPVSLSGVKVGSVESLTFPKDVQKNYIVVQIKVVGDVASRVRRDTVAGRRKVGLVGDKFI